MESKFVRVWSRNVPMRRLRKGILDEDGSG